MAMMGVTSFYLGTPLPAALSFLDAPALWAGLLLIALLLKVRKSFKVTKPLAEVAGTTESLAAMMAFAAMFFAGGSDLGGLSQVGVERASLLGTAVLMVAAMSGLLVVILVRMGFDLLTWISPVPFIDALLQFAKLLVTAMLVGVAVFSPPLAIALNIALLVAVFLAMRWLIRLARFALLVLWDGVFGRIRPDRVKVGQETLGPLLVFKVRGDVEHPRLVATDLLWTEDGWWLRGGKREPTCVSSGRARSAISDGGSSGACSPRRTEPCS